MCERTFRRYVDRYEEEGLQGLIDKRLGQVSARRAPVDEVAQTLQWAAERADCELYAAIVHIHEHGDAALGGDYVQSWG